MARDDSLENVIVSIKKINHEIVFPSMNQYLQMPGNSESMFVTGGGNGYEKRCFELVLRADIYEPEEKQNMNFGHVFHSMCYLDTDTIYVIGSRLKEGGADKSVESYSVSTNEWT